MAVKKDRRKRPERKSTTKNGIGTVQVKLVVNATQINSAALQAQGVPAASAPGLVTWMNNQIADQTEP